MSTSHCGAERPGPLPSVGNPLEKLETIGPSAAPATRVGCREVPRDADEREQRRLEALRRCDVLDTLEEQSFNDLASLAAAVCQTPIGLISLVDEHRQWFKAKVGIKLQETPREHSFCNHTIQQREVFVVPDAAADFRFADNPLVVGEPHIRFYAGVPLITESGDAIGAICVKDRRPRELNEAQLSSLRGIARLVVKQLELRLLLREQKRFLGEQARVEQALRVSEERFKQVAWATNDGIWDWDVVTDEVWRSEGFHALFGYQPNEVEPQRIGWLSRIHPEDRERILGSFAQTSAAKEQFWRGEYRFRRKDGTYAEVLSRGVVSYDAAGRAVRVVGGMSDLSQSKAAAARIADQAALLDAASDAILLIDLNGTVVYHNRVAERLYAGDGRSLVGRCACGGPLSDPRTYAEACRHLWREGFWHGEMEHDVGDGRVVVTEARWTLVHDAEGRPKSILAIQTDVTKKRELEAQLRQTQRLDALGALAGGIAHDFNNIIGAILGNVHLALEDLPPANPAGECLEEVRKAGLRAKQLVQQILTFSRQQSPKRAVIALEPVIEESLSLLRATLPGSVTLETHFAPGVPPIMADSTQIHQVMLNLGTNAWHALENRPGRINVSVEEAPAEVVHDLFHGVRQVLLKVTDTGKGMDEVTRKRIFEPFFTTKPVGQGTGLGLSVVHGIIQSHEGMIRVTSQPGQGACFELFFPAAPEPAPENPAQPEKVVPGQGQHVLLIDDEPAQVALSRRLLERLGYRCTGYLDGHQAIEAVRRTPGAFDLVISDYNMPGLSGLDVADRIRSIRPGLPVVLNSGFVPPEIKAEAERLGISRVLTKPNSIGELSEAIQRLMQAET
ncbi:MAG: PAS domain-containing protein [Verrucomicrobia bacterium]|nr:PAS domain-containing protein [Verrucomicrobiota bacterium]